MRRGVGDCTAGRGWKCGGGEGGLDRVYFTLSLSHLLDIVECTERTLAKGVSLVGG